MLLHAPLRQKRWKMDDNGGHVKPLIRSGQDFSTFDHCATRSDEIDDTSSAVTSETIERLMLASLRFLNTFGEQRHRRSRLHDPLSYRGPDDDSYTAETAFRWRPATHPRYVNTLFGTNRCRSIREISRYTETVDRMIQNELGHRSPWVVLCCKIVQTLRRIF